MSSLQFSDLDRDGDLELVTLFWPQTGAEPDVIVEINENNSGDYLDLNILQEGTLFLPGIGRDEEASIQVFRTAITDLDGDDIDDLIFLETKQKYLSDSSQSTMYFIPNNGMDTIVPFDRPAIVDPFGIELALNSLQIDEMFSWFIYFEDLEGDGDLDLLMFTLSEIEMGASFQLDLMYLLNLGEDTPEFDSTFNVIPLDTTMYTDSSRLVFFPHIVDLDEDGDSDILLNKIYNFQNYYTYEFKASNELIYIENKNEVSTGAQVIEELDVDIYPNPTSDAIRIKFSNPERYRTKVEVINSTGQLLHVGFAVSDQYQINHLASPSGLYFVRLTNPSGSVTKKVIYQN